MIALGLPPSPLPPRWWLGLRRSRIHRTVHIELTGAPTVGSEVHPKGYQRVYLGRQHPYADRYGRCYLHRWIKQRELGRRLPTYEHVHHERDRDTATTDDTKLAVMHAVDHGQYSYGVHFRRIHGRLEFVSCGREYCEWELELEAMAREAAEL